MKSKNQQILIGHVTANPELTDTKNGKKRCTFSIATNREWKDEKGEKQSLADFHNIVAWGKLAEICGQYLKKGSPVYVSGPSITRSWEDEDSKKKMYRTEIHIDELNMLGSSGGRGRGPEDEPDGLGYGGSDPEDKKDPNHFAEEEISIEDVPF